MMSTVDNLYTSVAALKEAYTHVDRTDQHVNRARHVQNTIAIIGLACIGLLAISFVCAKALSFNAFTVQVIETAILGSVVSLVIGFAIIKLVSQNLKQHKASLLAKMDGQMLYDTFLADLEGDWTDLTAKLNIEQWESWTDAAAPLISMGNQSTEELKMLQFLHKHCPYLGKASAFQQQRDMIAVTKT